MSYEDCYQYLARKVRQWSESPPQYDLRAYITSRGKDRLVQEFKDDQDFHSSVCNFLAETPEGGNDKDAIYSVLNNILSPGQNIMPSELEVVAEAILEACGRKQDSKGAKIVIGLLLLAALAGLAIAAGSRGRR